MPFLRPSLLPGAFLRALFMLAGLLLAATAVAGVPLRGEWRPSGSSTWQAFDPGERTRIPRGPAGAEIRLWPGATADTGEPWVLAIDAGTLERLRWHPPTGAAVDATLMDAQRQGWMGHGRIGFELPEPPRAGTPLRLDLLPQTAIASTMAFSLEPRSSFMAGEGRWLALVSTCLAVLVGMALIAAVFALRLRDRTFLWYAGYLLSYVLIQLLQTGYAASPLGWTLLTAAPRTWGRHAVVVSIVMIVLFLVRFADLPRWSPRSVRPLRLYAAAVAASAALALLPLDAAQAISRAAINPLLILGGPLLLGVGIRAWSRGSRYAGFFVVGWAPLLLATVAGSLQLFGWLRGWATSDETALVAAAFEALVLSAGLADRIALLRRDRDLARVLADTDPLTGVLNRRALDARLAALLSGSRQQAPVAALYCDIDHFKRLNDSHGHAAGDEALRVVARALSDELRPRDLIGRVGGEEFVIALPACDGVAALAVAERLCRRVRELGLPPWLHAGALTISIGVTASEPGESAPAVLARADAALYSAKAAGRDRVVGVAACPAAARTAAAGRRLRAVE